MSLEIEAINWVACVFTFIGTWMVGSKKANLLRVNQLYLLGSLFFIFYFVAQGMWVNVGLYIGLGGFAVRGWVHYSIPTKINLVPKDYIGKTRTLTFKRIE